MFIASALFVFFFFWLLQETIKVFAMSFLFVIVALIVLVLCYLFSKVWDERDDIF